MVVETALGDVQFARDPLHRGAAIAEFVDQPRRRAQELLASRLGLIVFEVDQIGSPLLARCGDAVREHIHQPLFDAIILIEIVADQQDRQPEGVLEQNVSERAEQIVPRLVGVDRTSTSMNYSNKRASSMPSSA